MPADDTDNGSLRRRGGPASVDRVRETRENRDLTNTGLPGDPALAIGLTLSDPIPGDAECARM
jgi:hypothetical protein